MGNTQSIKWQICPKCKDNKPNTMFDYQTCRACSTECKRLARQDIIKNLLEAKTFVEDQKMIIQIKDDCCRPECWCLFGCFGLLFLKCKEYNRARCYDCKKLRYTDDFSEKHNVCSFCIEKLVELRWKRYIDPVKTMIDDLGKDKAVDDIVLKIKEFL